MCFSPEQDRSGRRVSTNSDYTYPCSQYQMLSVVRGSPQVAASKPARSLQSSGLTSTSPASSRACGGRRQGSVGRVPRVQGSASLEAVVFDCDGVILESENLHRVAYNAAFEEFKVSCNGGESVVDWDVAFYDVLQNKVGGGKPKMRWYFGENGWPVSTINSAPPETNEEKEQIIDELQEWKSEKYRDLIGSGDVPPRPGVLRFMEEAKSKGLKVAVCSAATKSSVIFTLTSLLGEEKFNSLDCFLAGDDVKEKKPSPLIYQVAAEKLGVDPSQCLVIEDSMIGLQAATGAGMRCIVTYTGSTKQQDFAAAEQIMHTLDGPPVVKVDDFC